MLRSTARASTWACMGRSTLTSKGAGLLDFLKAARAFTAGWSWPFTGIVSTLKIRATWSSRCALSRVLERDHPLPCVCECVCARACGCVCIRPSVREGMGGDGKGWDGSDHGTGPLPRQARRRSSFGSCVHASARARVMRTFNAPAPAGDAILCRSVCAALSVSYRTHGARGHAVQMLARHWQFVDATARASEVKGPGTPTQALPSRLHVRPATTGRPIDVRAGARGVTPVLRPGSGIPTHGQP